jgi:hypothetical protein
MFLKNYEDSEKISSCQVLRERRVKTAIFPPSIALLHTSLLDREHWKSTGHCEKPEKEDGDGSTLSLRLVEHIYIYVLHHHFHV